MNSRNLLPGLSTTSVVFQCGFASIIGSTTLQTLALWQSTNWFQRPGVSIMNAARILCYMKVTGSTFELSWNTYFALSFAGPGPRAEAQLIVALPSFRSLRLFPMTTHSFSLNCWLGSWAFQDLGRLFTPWLPMNVRKSSWRAGAMHGTWLLNAVHKSIPEASSFDCSWHAIEEFRNALSVVIASKWPFVSLTQFSMCYNYTASLVLTSWPVNYHS